MKYNVLRYANNVVVGQVDDMSDCDSAVEEAKASVTENLCDSAIVVDEDENLVYSTSDSA